MHIFYKNTKGGLYMSNFRKVIILLIIIIFINIYSYCSFAIEDDIYVWSPSNLAPISTSATTESNTR